MSECDYTPLPVEQCPTSINITDADVTAEKDAAETAAEGELIEGTTHKVTIPPGKTCRVSIASTATGTDPGAFQVGEMSSQTDVTQMVTKLSTGQSYDADTTRIVSAETSGFEFANTGRIKALKDNSYVMTLHNNSETDEHFVVFNVMGASSLVAASASVLALASVALF